MTLSTTSGLAPSGAPLPPPHSEGPRPWRWVALVAAAAAAGWAPFIAKSVSPDEGGFLLVASQWHAGTSLYGDYWVDRPPLLITLFQLADLLGGAVPLRLLGISAVLASVFLAAAIGRSLDSAGRAGSRALVLPAATAAVFLTTPLFGTTEVNGELLAVPFVLGGVWCLVATYRAASPGFRTAVLAGLLGAAAVLVKQNVVDVFVTAFVLVLVLPAHDVRRRVVAVGTAVGAALGLAAGLAWAALHGTGADGLFDAIVTFRLEASRVIGSSANDATPHRLLGMGLAFAASGALAVLVVALAGVVRDRRRPVDHAFPYTAALALLAWELAGMLAGGSYWLHYLIGLVPGLVVLVVLSTVAAADRGPRGSRWLARTLVGSAAVGALVVAGVAVHDVTGTDEDGLVVAYLRAHARPTDGVVVGFGHPDIVQRSGLSSPYPELWSLPVRVRDPDLTAFTKVLDGPAPPRWVVVSGASLDTWGVRADAAQATLDREYAEVTSAGNWHVFELRTTRTGY